MGYGFEVRNKFGEAIRDGKDSSQGCLRDSWKLSGGPPAPSYPALPRKVVASYVTEASCVFFHTCPALGKPGLPIDLSLTLILYEAW